MEHDVEDTVIRPRRGGALPTEPDDSDTRLVTRLRGPAARPSVDAVPPVRGPQHAPTPPALVAQAVVADAAVYRFRVNSHEPIDLNRPAHIGRKPALPRVPPPLRPRLVRVPSPLQEVSGTHLEVRQQGTSVVITDLRSTNGTTVTMPGSRPRGLRPGESLVVTPGTLIDIGDGNLIEILPLQRTMKETSMSEGVRQ